MVDWNTAGKIENLGQFRPCSLHVRWLPSLGIASSSLKSSALTSFLQFHFSFLFHLGPQ